MNTLKVKSSMIRTRAKLLIPIGLAVSIGLAIMLLLSQSARASGSTTITTCSTSNLVNALGGGGSITFNCGSSHQPATIILTSQQMVTQPTSINGGGVITIGGGLTRTFIVVTGTQLSLSNLTIYNSHVISPDLAGGGAIINFGTLVVTAGKFLSNSVDDGPGGGAILTYGTLTVTGSSFIKNFGGSAAFGDGGGGVKKQGGVVTVKNTLFMSNTTDSIGGAIYNEDGNLLRVVGSTFIANRSNAGGAIDSDAETLMIIDTSVFSNNVALVYGGGAIWMRTVMITSSTFFNNQAYNTTDGFGGALYIYAGYTATVANSRVYNNHADGMGGGIANEGTLHLSNSWVYNNRSLDRGGGLTLSDLGTAYITTTAIYSNSAQAYGGGVDNDGTLFLQDVSLYDNTVNAGAGGIDSDGRLTMNGGKIYGNQVITTGYGFAGGLGGYGDTTLTNVDIYNNLLASGTGDGGGIENGGTMTLTNVNIFANTVITQDSTYNGGAGIDNYSGRLNIINSAIFSNTVTNGDGGGIASSGALTITNSTIYGNSAKNGTSGGLVNSKSSATLVMINSTIVSNSASSGAAGLSVLSGTAQVHNTIHANQLGATTNCAGSITSLGHNLSNDNSCNLSATGDLTNTNPLLSPFANYGGSTRSMLPMPGSPAIDHGDNTGCPATDQRGFLRPLDGDGNGSTICDIGAVEAGMNTYLPIALKNF